VQTLQVDVGHSRYPISIGSGLLANRDLLEGCIRGRDLLIVTNTTVAHLYLAKLRDSLAGRRVAECILPDGEQHKTLQTAGWVFDALVGKRMNRDVTVLALGGGVVGDIAGFAIGDTQTSDELALDAHALERGGEKATAAMHDKNLVPLLRECGDLPGEGAHDSVVFE